MFAGITHYTQSPEEGYLRQTEPIILKELYFSALRKANGLSLALVPEIELLIYSLWMEACMAPFILCVLTAKILS